MVAPKGYENGSRDKYGLVRLPHSFSKQLKPEQLIINWSQRVTLSVLCNISLAAVTHFLWSFIVQLYPTARLGTIRWTFIKQ